MFDRKFLLGALHGLLLACAGSLVMAAAAKAGDAAAFQKALRAQNAAHLDAAFPESWSAGGSVVEGIYSDEGEKGPWEYRAGDLAIRVEMKRTAPIDLSSFPVPVLTLSLAGEEMISVTGSEAHADFAAFIFQLAELDTGNPHPEIVFSSFTGGAHCCSDTRVLTGGEDGRQWREIEAGLFDGDLLRASDVDGDGRYELVMRDNRFLYRFGCYACSAAPLRILQLQGGEMADVSAGEGFRDAHRDSLVRMIQLYNAGSEESNGFLAGYVAQKIRLGEGKEAWDFMTEYHDAESDWGLVECSEPLNDRNECPGKTTAYSFPDGLKRFLADAGYPVPE